MKFIFFCFSQSSFNGIISNGLQYHIQNEMKTACTLIVFYARRRNFMSNTKLFVEIKENLF